MASRSIIIVGIGGFGREVLELLIDCNAERSRWNIEGFVQTDHEDASGECCGLPILGGMKWVSQQKKLAAVVGIGHPGVKRTVVESCSRFLEFPTIIHPSVIMSKRVTIDPQGVVITAGNILTTNITLDAHVMINLACTVGHDVHIGRYAVVSPGVNISGNVRVGEGANLGTGSAIIEGKSIGAWSIVGAGAVVTSDIPENVTAVGVPAKVIKSS